MGRHRWQLAQPSSPTNVIGQDEKSQETSARVPTPAAAIAGNGSDIVTAGAFSSKKTKERTQREGALGEEVLEDREGK